MRTELIVVAGFLESGKTKLINNLQGKIADDNLPVVIMCELGFAELSDVFEDVVYIESLSEISSSFFQDLINKYPNRKFIMEYNGTWKLSYLFTTVLPRNMVIEKVIYTLSYATHEEYLLNMPTLLLEQINYSQVFIVTGIEDIIRFEGRPYEVINELRPGIKIFSQDQYKLSDDFIKGKPSPYLKIFLWMLLIVIVVFTMKNYLM